MQEADQRLLAMRRLLQAADPGDVLLDDHSCRLDPAAVAVVWQHIAMTDPTLQPRLQQQWRRDSAGAGLWMQLSLPVHHSGPALERRWLFTAAGLGLCPEELL